LINFLKTESFNGYKNLHDDMKSNALYYFIVNLNKGNIKIKSIKKDETCFVKSSRMLKGKFSIHEDLIGKEVLISKILGNEIEVSEVLEKDVTINDYVVDDRKFVIDKFYIRFNNIHTYITCIIIDSFWKIVNEENFQKNKKQLFFNIAEKNNKNDTSNETCKYDNTTEHNKRKIQKMMSEARTYQKNLKIKTIRRKSCKLVSNDIFRFCMRNF